MTRKLTAREKRDRAKTRAEARAEEKIRKERILAREQQALVDQERALTGLRAMRLGTFVDEVAEISRYQLRKKPMIED